MLLPAKSGLFLVPKVIEEKASGAQQTFPFRDKKWFRKR